MHQRQRVEGAVTAVDAVMQMRRRTTRIAAVTDEAQHIAGLKKGEAPRMPDPAAVRIRVYQLV